MRYFILLPGDTEESVDFSTNILGEVSFKNFWADQGFGILIRLVEKYPDTLEEVVIKDEQSKLDGIKTKLDNEKDELFTQWKNLLKETPVKVDEKLFTKIYDDRISDVREFLKENNVELE